MATNLNAKKVQSLVLPNLDKASEWIQGAYDLSSNLKSTLPSSTIYKNYANDLPNKIYNIQKKIKTTNNQIDTKIKDLVNIENIANSKVANLTKTLNTMMATFSATTAASSNNSKISSLVNIKQNINNTGAKYTKKFTSLFKNICGGLKETGAEVSNYFKSLFSKKNETKSEETIKTETTVDNTSKVKQSSFNYKDLFDTSLDDKKLFGKDTTLGLNGERIVFDKIYKYDDGSRVYMKDGEVVKRITDDCVEIGNTTYYKDGTYSTERENTGEWDSILDYYTEDGILSKVKKIGLGADETVYYNENGVVIKKEIGTSIYNYDERGNLLKEVHSDGSFKEYDSTGKLIKERDSHGYETIYKSEKAYLKYNRDGNIIEEVNTDGSTVLYNDDGTKRYEVKSDGTKIQYYSQFKYQEIKPNGQNITYELYENGSLKKVSTPNGPYDSFYKEYDVTGKIITNKCEYGTISYENGVASKIKLTGSYGHSGGVYRVRGSYDGEEYIWNLNENQTKVLSISAPNGKIIAKFPGGINIDK